MTQPDLSPWLLAPTSFRYIRDGNEYFWDYHWTINEERAIALDHWNQTGVVDRAHVKLPRSAH